MVFSQLVTFIVIVLIIGSLMIQNELGMKGGSGIIRVIVGLILFFGLMAETNADTMVADYAMFTTYEVSDTTDVTSYDDIYMSMSVAQTTLYNMLDSTEHNTYLLYIKDANKVSVISINTERYSVDK